MNNGLEIFTEQWEFIGVSDSILSILQNGEGKEEVLERLRFDRDELTKVIDSLEDYEPLTDSERFDRVLSSFNCKSPAEYYESIAENWRLNKKQVSKFRFDKMPEEFQRAFILNYADGALSYFLLKKFK